MLPGSGLSFSLPRQLTAFVGRERELAAVVDALSDHRLVTLCGPGGAGKTRLALAAAERVLDGYPDGVFVVELADVGDAQLVPSCVASVLGVGELPEIGITATLVEALLPAHALVILDNCEHLVDACAQLAFALLQGCPTLHMLASSREPLGVPGEMAWRLPLLETPSAERPPSPTEMSSYDSVRLFVERAHTFNPSFEMTDANAAAVVEICELTEGLPLAIELAAGRLTTLSAEQVAAQLHDALGMLTSASRLMPARHRTLRATIDWSYERLSPHEKVLFNRLSVFSGLASLEGVRAVCADDSLPAVEILDNLARLIDKSLVQAEAAQQELRYRLLELMRQYAAEKLAETGEAELLRARHAAFFAAMAEASSTEAARTSVSEWTERLALERANWRAALAWSLQADPPLALRLAASLAWFWRRLSNLAEGRRWLELALAAPGGDPAVRAGALGGAGRIVYRQGDCDAAQALLTEALSLTRQLGDQAGEARLLRSLGLVLLALADYPRATSCLEDALAIQERLGNRLDMQRTLSSLAVVDIAAGSYDYARDRLERSAAMARETGDEWSLASTIGTQAELALELGDHEAARTHLQVSTGMLAQLRDPAGVAYRLEGFARLAAASAQPERALSLAAAAGTARARLGAVPVPHWRRRLDEALARSRRSLAPPAAAEAEARGARMSVDEAIAFALQLQENGGQRAARETAIPSWASDRSRAAGLSAREWEVLALLMTGLPSRLIAPRLSISQNTVNKHVASILEKLGARSRAQAIAMLLGLEHAE